MSTTPQKEHNQYCREGFKIAFSIFMQRQPNALLAFFLVPSSLLTQHMNEGLKATAFTRKPWEEIMDRLVQVSKLNF